MRSAADHPLHQAFLEAGSQHPIGVTDDVNGYKQEGIGHFDLSIDKGKRQVILLCTKLGRSEHYTYRSLTRLMLGRAECGRREHSSATEK